MHYPAATNIDHSKFQGRLTEKYFICRLINNKPKPNLHSGDTFLDPEGVF